MTRQEEAARELEAAVGDLLAQASSWSDDDWVRVVPSTGWTRAATVMHCAIGNDVATAWTAYLVSQRDILDTPDFHDQHNQAMAERCRLADRESTLAALKRSSERAARYLRSLTDEEIDRPARHGLAQREMTAGQFLPNFARHVTQHLKSAINA